MSSLHGLIMNLPCDDVKMYASLCEDARLSYKFGHRDARHAAAELASEFVCEVHDILVFARDSIEGSENYHEWGTGADMLEKINKLLKDTQ